MSGSENRLWSSKAVVSCRWCCVEGATTEMEVEEEEVEGGREEKRTNKSHSGLSM